MYKFVLNMGENMRKFFANLSVIRIVMAAFFVVGLCVGVPTNARAVGDEEIQMTITYSGDTMYSYVCRSGEPCFFGCKNGAIDCGTTDIFSKPGYKLVAWTVESLCDAGTNPVAGNFAPVEEISGAITACDGLSFDLVAYPQYQETTYTAVFDCGDGMGTPPSNIENIKYGSSVDLPESTCYKTGLNLVGWAVEGTNDIVSDDFVWQYYETPSTKLIAQYADEINRALVTFDLNGATSGRAPAISYNKCSNLSCYLPVPGDTGYDFKRNGYAFLGWLIEGESEIRNTTDGNMDLSDIVTSTNDYITAIAQWAPICYKVTVRSTNVGGNTDEFYLYKKTDDVNTYADADCTPGNEVTDLRDIDMETPTKDNAKFIGIYNANIRLPLTSGFACIDEQGTVYNDAECNVDSSEIWFSRFACNGTGEITSTACPPVSTITYSCGSGIGMPPAKQQVLQGDTVTILNNLTCQYAGMDFVGWLLDGELVEPGAEIVWDYDTNKTLTPKWQEKFMKMTITYNAGMNVTGVTGTNNTQQVCTTTDEGYCILGCIDGATCSDGQSNVFSRVGYDLTGWTLNDNCSGDVFYEKSMPAIEDLTGAAKACTESDYFSVSAVAQWTAKTYNLNYTCGDGTGTATGASTIAYDSEFNLPNGSGCTGPAGSPILAGWRITNNGEILTSPIVWKYSDYDSYTLEAVWASDEVGTTVVFNLDGGTGSVPSYTSNVCSNILCKLPKEGYPSGYTLSRNGYTFAGWSVYDGENLKDAFYSVDGDMDIAQMITENVPVTATAVWEPECNLIRITNIAGGSDDATIEVYKKTGETATYSDKTCTTVVTKLADVSAVPTKANATFAGVYNGSARYPLTTGYQCITEDGTFSTEAECNVSGTTQWYSRFACNTGYTYAGTVIREACEVAQNKMWISYSYGDYTVTNVSPVHDTTVQLCTGTGTCVLGCMENNNCSVQDIYTRPGYTLTSWVLNDDCGGLGEVIGVDTTMNSIEDLTGAANACDWGNFTITAQAQWQPISYEVTFDCGSGSGSAPANQTIAYDETFNLPENTCTNGDMIFGGWKVSGTNDIKTASFTWNYTDNKTLVAQWVSDMSSATVIFNLNGGSGTAPKLTPNECTSLSCVLPKSGDLGYEFSRTGYEFVGWSLNDAVKFNDNLQPAGIDIGSGITDGIAITATAVWEPECNLIRITNIAGGSDDATIEVYKKTGETATYSDKTCTTVVTKLADVSAVPTKANATFAGVYNGSARYPLTTGYQCITEDGTFSTEAECNVSGTTQWYSRFACNTGWTGSGTIISGECTPFVYTVTYKCGDATGTPPAEVTVADGTKFSPANFTGCSKPGYEFTYWLSTQKGEDVQYYYGSSYDLTSDIVLVAQWAPERIRIALDANGGTGGDTSVEATYGQDMPDIEVPTRKGYVLLGFYEDKEDPENDIMPYYYSNGKSARRLDTNMQTLYAVWRPESYQVMYSCGEGTGTVPSNQWATYDNTFTPADNTGCTNGSLTFAGWWVC